MTEQPELMNLYWTTAGMFPGRREISRFDFVDRVTSAAKAGFRGIGLWHTDLEHVLIHHTLPEVRTILADNGMKHLELEFLTDWFLTGGRKGESDHRKRRLLEASAALGAHHVKIGDFYNTPCPMPQLIDAFATLCAEAAQHGATIGIEFMASSRLSDLKQSLEMIDGAGAPNGGVIVDIVHVVNIGIPYAEVAAIPKAQLVCVELNDGLQPGPVPHDAGQRRFCGEGEFDIAGFIAAVRATGYDGPWAVEVFSDALEGWPLDRLNRTAYDTTIAQFAPGRNLSLSVAKR